MNHIRPSFRSVLLWVSFVGIVTAFVLGAWGSLMLLPEFGEDEVYVASAQEALEDACSSARLLNYVDVTLTTYDPDGTPSGYRVESRASRQAQSSQTFIDGALQSETIRLTRDLDSSVTRASESTTAMIEITEYTRPSGGQWEMSQFTEEKTESGSAFCGWSTDNFQTLARVGTEILNGATTTKYEAARDLPGDQWDATWEFWVTDAGQMVQMVIHRRDGKAKMVYYDFNGVNVIRPPITLTPTPSPTPPATPSPTPTLPPGRAQRAP